MKVLQILTVAALLAVSLELKAQSNIPRSLSPRSFSGMDYSKYDIRPLQLNSPADSATLSEIQSRLNQKSIEIKNKKTHRDLNTQPADNRIPADSRHYMNYLDRNGQKLYKPKSSLDLMTY